MRVIREWNLRWPQRLAIICCAAGYLLFARPWNAPSQSAALGGYTCSAAILTLALIPKRTRLWVAVCAALAVPLLVDIAANVVH
jgi:hypothetical protein